MAKYSTISVGRVNRKRSILDFFKPRKENEQQTKIATLTEVQNHFAPIRGTVSRKKSHGTTSSMIRSQSEVRLKGDVRDGNVDENVSIIVRRKQSFQNLVGTVGKKFALAHRRTLGNLRGQAQSLGRETSPNKALAIQATVGIAETEEERWEATKYDKVKPVNLSSPKLTFKVPQFYDPPDYDVANAVSKQTVTGHDALGVVTSEKPARVSDGISDISAMYKLPDCPSRNSTIDIDPDFRDRAIRRQERYLSVSETKPPSYTSLDMANNSMPQYSLGSLGLFVEVAPYDHSRELTAPPHVKSLGENILTVNPWRERSDEVNLNPMLSLTRLLPAGISDGVLFKNMWAISDEIIIKRTVKFTGDTRPKYRSQMRAGTCERVTEGL
ncbi:MAG: hypothetical protein M1818_007557 [Claussenomyces sp. TS43310]|nr:MAG: hypothetical protein M1818_007557 [Claussenomyces sp. TS43310]